MNETPAITRQQALLELLYQALGEPIGLVLRSNDRTRARQALYAVRRKQQDCELNQLQIRFAPWDDSQLVLTKGVRGHERAEPDKLEAFLGGLDLTGEQ